MEQITATGFTEQLGDISTVAVPDRNRIHLFAERGYGPSPDLPDGITAPAGTWQFSAPYSRGAVILTEGLTTDFPDLSEAFEVLGHTIVEFPNTTLVRCMLDQLYSDGPYKTAEAVVDAYYTYDLEQGDYAAPELSSSDFNELHVEGVLELGDTASYRLHEWLSEKHPEYDFFLPETPASSYNLTPLDQTE